MEDAGNALAPLTPADLSDPAHGDVALPGGRSTNPVHPPPNPPRAPHSLWYALVFPQLTVLDSKAQKHILIGLAKRAHTVSGTVSFHPQALVLEIRSSLRYFGGLNAIHDLLKPRLQAWLRKQQLVESFHHAAAPTVTASLLLARSGRPILVQQPASLRSALGRLPVDVLNLDREASRRLQQLGVRQLRDLWRLPRDGLRRRFGSAFVTLLDQALGRASEPTLNYLPPPLFETGIELSHEIDDLNRLLPVLDEMVVHLCEFLVARDLSTSHLQVVLRHEHQQETCLDMRLRHASRERQHLICLLETRLAQLHLAAPVVSLHLRVKRFDVFTGRTIPLHPLSTPQAGESLTRFLEQLEARLGAQAIKGIRSIADHCPEYASDEVDPSSAGEPAGMVIPSNPRPLWLLPESRPLTIRHGCLYHERPVTIVSGPERIETRWWSGGDIRRDYYVAQEAGGALLWIYHEKGPFGRWLLQGIFA